MKFEIHGSFRTSARPMAPGGPGKYGAKPFDKRETWNAFAFLVALGLPFSFAGLWGLSQAPGKWLSHDTTGALFHAAAGFAFTAVGVGLIAGSLWARGKVARDAALAFAHPDEPWKWREDWAAGHVLDRPGNASIAIGIFAFLWNAIALPVAIRGMHASLFVLLFPAAGLWLALWALRLHLRAKAQGISRLDLDAVPVPVGRTLSGTVRTHLAQIPPEGFELVLTALRTMRSSDDDDVTSRIVWQDEARVAGQPYGDATGVFAGAPVAFRIPVEVPSTDHSDTRDELEWELVVRAKGYEATFDLPVYRTEESGTPETARAATHLRAVPSHGDPIPASFAVPAMEADAPRPEPRSPIEVANDREGLVIDFPPGRNPGPARGLTSFAVLWTAAIVLMTRLHAPVFFPVVFALFDALFIWLALRLWFETARVRANGGGVKVARGLAEPGRERFVPAGEIADVRLSIGMSSGTKAWYDLALHLKNGRRIPLGEGVRNKREAEWLAARLLRALGRSS